MNRLHRVAALAIVCGLVALLSFSGAVQARSSRAAVVYSNVQPIGPFWQASGIVGGEVEPFTMATDTGLIGDVVYISASGSVRRITATTATHLAVAGVIVGGSATSNRVVTDSASVLAGTRAALPSTGVLVMRRGVYWVRNDTGAGTVSAGGLVRGPSFIAGRLAAYTTAAGDSGKTFGRARTSGTAGSVFRLELGR